jgi:pimeloyl-ACP methyl ester carboxylesterase
MEIEQHGPDDGPPLVCIFGWGNRLYHDNVQWLIDQFAEDGYRVHAIEIPLAVTDFYADYIEPVEEYVGDLESFRLVGHSTGGLIGAYIDGATTETYLSPWWGFRESAVAAGDHFLSVLGKIPIAKRVIPKGQWTPEQLGTLATEEQLADSPEYLAPAFVREGRRAQRDRPPVPDDAVVFCSLTDEIVSVRAIGVGAPAARTVIYDGGHELFSSPSRDDHVDTLLAVVADGADGLEN